MFQRLASTAQACHSACATQSLQPPLTQSQMVAPQLPQPLVSPQGTTPPVTTAQATMDTSAPQGVPTIKRVLEGCSHCSLYYSGGRSPSTCTHPASSSIFPPKA